MALGKNEYSALVWLRFIVPIKGFDFFYIFKIH